MAEAELEYDKNHISPSLYIRFKINKTSGTLSKYQEIGDLYALIWTTTPWTLPSNQAISFNPELSYTLIKLNSNDEFYIVATDLVASLREKLISHELDEITTVSAADLEHSTYFHPIDRENELPFLKGSHVTSTAGTGLVHTAPAHGFDDYLVALKENISVVSITHQSNILTNESFSLYNSINDETLKLLSYRNALSINLVLITKMHQIFCTEKKFTSMEINYVRIM